jgi:hypothetical protein
MALLLLVPHVRLSQCYIPKCCAASTGGREPPQVTARYMTLDKVSVVSPRDPQSAIATCGEIARLFQIFSSSTGNQRPGRPSHRIAQGIQMHRAWACEITVVLMRGAARSRPRRLVVQSCSRSRTNVYISNLISREMKHRHSYAVPQAAR